LKHCRHHRQYKLLLPVHRTLAAKAMGIEATIDLDLNGKQRMITTEQVTAIAVKIEALELMKRLFRR